jgi:Domain of unknown function (DUF397)
MAEATPTTWRKSSRSGGGENCVELACLDGRIVVRDSKQPSGPHLTFTAGPWLSFIHRAKHDQHQHGR